MTRHACPFCGKPTATRRLPCARCDLVMDTEYAAEHRRLRARQREGWSQ